MNNPRSNRKSLWASGGSVLAAAIASACCWLPLLLIVVGASAGGVSVLFEQTRPWFLAVSGALLALGFYLNYFRREKCEDGEACATPNRTLQRTSRVVLWVATAGVLAFALLPTYVGALVGDRHGAEQGSARRVILKVGGMTCGGCAVTVEQALLKVPGVMAARVSFEEGRAVVTVDPASPAPAQSLVGAVAWSGYTASLRPEDSRSDP